MSKFILQIFRNHQVFVTNNRTVLLDTGAPITISRDERFRFMNQSYTLPKTFNGITTEMLSEFIGTRIDVLLGADIFSIYHVLINVKAKTITFSNVKPNRTGDTFKFENLMGVPIIHFDFNGKTYKGFLDTGAAISFIKTGMFGDLPVLGERDDFFPTYGSFKTPTYEGTIRVSQKSFKTVIGNLPETLDSAIMLGDIEGVIGFDLFKSFEVLMNYPDNTITLF